MAAGTMNIISNLKGKLRTAILIEKVSLEMLNLYTENYGQRLSTLVAFARSQQIRRLSTMNRLYI